MKFDTELNRVNKNKHLQKCFLKKPFIEKDDAPDICEITHSDHLLSMYAKFLEKQTFLTP